MVFKWFFKWSLFGLLIVASRTSIKYSLIFPGIRRKNRRYAGVFPYSCGAKTFKPRTAKESESLQTSEVFQRDS